MHNKIIYIKQHSVFSSDGENGRIWREEKHVSWLNEQQFLVSWWHSSFDHYNKIQRRGSISINNVELKKFWVPKYKKNVSVLRLLGNILFSIQIFVNLIRLKNSYHTVICAYPTPESSFAATLACVILKKRLITDVRDKWPEALVSEQRISFKRFFFSLYVNLLNKVIFSHCKIFIGMSDGVLEKVKVAAKNEDKYKVITIPNTHEEKILKSKYQQSQIKKTRLTFFGTLNSQFTFDPLDNVCRHLEFKYPEILITIIGSGERLEYYKQRFSKQKNIEFTGRLNHDDLLKIADESFGFFCFYKDPVIYENHFTNKFVEYLTFGKPFIHNLSADFTLNDIQYSVGTSLNDLSFVDFIEVHYDKFNKIRNDGLLRNFYEKKNKELFISVIKNCHLP